MQRVLMLGPPGSGKGTQGVRLARALGVEHVSSGALLREAVAAGTPLGRQVEQAMLEGHLVSDELVSEAVRPALGRRNGYVLDGFPRKLSQTEGVHFDAVVHLDVPEDEVTRRLLARGRADDSEDVIAERLREYRDDTLPLLEHYRDVVVDVDGDRDPDEIAADLRARLEN